MSQQLRGDLKPFEEQALIYGIAERETQLRKARSHTEVRIGKRFLYMYIIIIASYNVN